jgi:hypothetical protein
MGIIPTHAPASQARGLHGRFEKPRSRREPRSQRALNAFGKHSTSPALESSNSILLDPLSVRTLVSKAKRFKSIVAAPKP